MNSCEIYQKRHDATLTALKQAHETEEVQKLNTHEYVRFNVKFMMDRRQGDYLIKMSGPYASFLPSYLDFSYKNDGWVSFSTRARSQWFTGQEVRELLHKVKGMRAVKRNGKR